MAEPTTINKALIVPNTGDLPGTWGSAAINPDLSAIDGMLGGARRPTILSNQFVKSRTGSTTNWFLGDFKRAIYWMQVWAIETLNAVDNNEVSFTQDIWSRTRVSYRGVGQMVEPRYITRNDA